VLSEAVAVLAVTLAKAVTQHMTGELLSTPPVGVAAQVFLVQAV
tara:strand:- start:93 stop:224 length:132 start_codon:yes stop_codon:yes gene_type:complete